MKRMQSTGFHGMKGSEMERAVIRIALLLSAALMLSGCQNAGDRAEAEYKIFKAAGPSEREDCEQMHKVANAWLSEQNNKKYKEWELNADLACLHDKAVRGTY